MKEEMLYRIDENNEVIGKVSRSEVVTQVLPHRGTGVYVFNSKGEILITKRAMAKDTAPGLLEIGQGGKVSYGESYEENAIRELEEEIGVKNAELEFLFDGTFKHPTDWGFSRYFKCIHDGPFMFQIEEIEDHFFISIDELKKMVEESPEKFAPACVYYFKKYIQMTEN